MSTKKNVSLEEVHQSVDAINKKGFWRKLFAFLGPAYLISVGYMDPGNWATDIAGGSKFGYALIWVLVMSNLMALLLQSHSARLGIVRKLDLAQASRVTYPPFVNACLWFLAEIAIAATDLAEVIGMAIGLQLLFGLDLLTGVTITIFDTFLLFVLIRFGMRKMEAFIISLIAIIGLSFLVQMFISKPEISEIAGGLIPIIENKEALYIAIGIIGATVMPHNLYLHSSLVQTRRIERSEKGILDAIKYNIIDSAIALNMALFVNAGILILAAASFYNNGIYNVSEIQDAHKLLEPVLGSELSPILFAVALIAAGQSSTLTGTLSGQIVMEGYLNLRIQPWLRRLITRVIAIIPAYLVIIYYGENATGELLILSQVILSLQLGFAIIPLIHLVSDKNKMGNYAIKPVTALASWVVALIIVALNVKLVGDTLFEFASSSDNFYVFYFLLLPICVFFAGLLLYISFYPLKKLLVQKTSHMHDTNLVLTISEQKKYTRIAVSVDFTKFDNDAINNAISQGGKNAEYLLIHIVETAAARLHEFEVSDQETQADKELLNSYINHLQSLGYNTRGELGYGTPYKQIAEIVNKSNSDLLVMAAHGHHGIKDLILGETVNKVRHVINIPVLVVKTIE